MIFFCFVVECGQIGCQAFAVTRHSHVKDDIYIGVIESRQSFNLMLQQMN